MTKEELMELYHKAEGNLISLQERLLAAAYVDQTPATQIELGEIYDIRETLVELLLTAKQ